MALPWLLLAVTVGAGSPDLESAEHAYRDGSYQKIEALLHRAWQRPMSERDVHRALELEALSRAAFDQGEEAIEAFQYLLALDPQYLPDSQASPKLLGFFAEARRRGPLGIVSKSVPVQEARPAWVPTQAPVAPTASEGTPLYKQWWLWVGAAVGVGAAGAGAWVELHPIVPSGSLGQRTMQ
jgi:hypothetical protein